MALPYGRNTSYIAGNSPSISANDLNQIQDYEALIYNMLGLQADYPSATSDEPQVAIKDALDNKRFMIDHNGMPIGGRLCEFREDWDDATSPTTGSQKFSQAAGGDPAVTTEDPSTSYAARCAVITPKSTASGFQSITTLPLLLSDIQRTLFSMEFEVGIPSGTASNVSWFAGLMHFKDAYNDLSGCVLYKGYSSTNYALRTGDGTGVHVGTAGVAPGGFSYPTDRIRIEVDGQNTVYGAYQARLWINGVLRQTANELILPAATTWRIGFGSYCDGGAPVGSPVMRVGPVHAVWKRYDGLNGL